MVSAKGPGAKTVKEQFRTRGSSTSGSGMMSKHNHHFSYTKNHHESPTVFYNILYQPYV
jgi:hypothetical protein